MCPGRLPLPNVPRDPGVQMAFYVVFTTVVLDRLLNLFVFLTQLPAPCLLPAFEPSLPELGWNGHIVLLLRIAALLAPAV